MALLNIRFYVILSSITSYFKVLEVSGGAKTNSTQLEDNEDPKIIVERGICRSVRNAHISKAGSVLKKYRTVI